MKKKHWVLLGSTGVVAIMAFGCIQQAIDFNNQMIALQEMKKAEIETTKIEYGQCIVKIMEINQIAKNYRNDIMAFADKAGKNLEEFNKHLIALMGTQVIPQLSPELRLTVQREIITCRNAYVGRVDLSIKPMFVDFNRLQRQFPNNIYNSLIFHWQPDALNLPKNDAGQSIFDSRKVNALNLD